MSPQDRIDQLLIEVQRTGEAYAEAAFLESVLQDGRTGVREAAKERLTTATPNPESVLGAIPPRVRSESAAEKMVGLDPFYAEHLEAERKATKAKNDAYTAFTVARLRAFLAKPVDSDMVLDFDLVRSKADAREEMPGGVPQ